MARFTSGWLPFYRGLYDVFPKDPASRDIYMWLCARANLAQGKTCLRKQGYTLLQGQLATSEREIANETGWDRKTVQRKLDLLVKMDHIRATKGPHGTVITINDYYELYSNEKNKGPQKSRNGATVGATDGATVGSYIEQGTNNNKTKGPQSPAGSLFYDLAQSTQTAVRHRQPTEETPE